MSRKYEPLREVQRTPLGQSRDFTQSNEVRLASPSQGNSSPRPEPQQVEQLARPVPWTDQGRMDEQQRSALAMVKAHHAQRQAGLRFQDQQDSARGQERPSLTQQDGATRKKEQVERTSDVASRNKYAALREQKSGTIEVTDAKERAKEKIRERAQAFETKENTRLSPSNHRGGRSM